MASDSPGNIKASKIILPIVIGLAIVGWMLYRDVDNDVLDNFTFTWHSYMFIALACLFMVGRDLGYIIRIRLLSRGSLSWKQAFRVIMLWEFTSAITPSAVGGTSVATVFIHKEGLSVGKSASIVMLTAFFDELYLCLLFPVLIFAVGVHEIFGLHFGHELMWFAYIGFGLKFLLLAALTYGLFIKPKGLKWLITSVFRLPFLGGGGGDDIILSSGEIKKYSPGFWFKAFAATFLSWTSRFLVVNALFMAFFTFKDHLLLLGRQLVMWIMMVVAPTPGGSGIAEIIFKNFLGDIMPVGMATQAGTAVMIAIMWRLITYYPYLAIGAIIVPRWFDRSFKVRRKSKKDSPNTGVDQSL